MPHRGDNTESDEESGGTGQGNSGAPSLIPSFVRRMLWGRAARDLYAPVAQPSSKARNQTSRRRVWPHQNDPNGVEVYEVTMNGVVSYELRAGRAIISDYTSKALAITEASKLAAEMIPEQTDAGNDAGAKPPDRWFPASDEDTTTKLP